MKTTTNPGIKWGLISGLAGVLLSVLVWALLPDMMFSGWIIFLSVVLAILFAVLAGLERRKQLGGYMNFKEGLKTVFLTFVIGGFIATIYTYVLYNFIDPAMPEKLKHYQLETAERWMTRFKAPQEEIDKQLDELAAQDASLTLGKAFLGYLQQLIFGFILAAIIATHYPEKNSPWASGSRTKP